MARKRTITAKSAYTPEGTRKPVVQQQRRKHNKPKSKQMSDAERAMLQAKYGANPGVVMPAIKSTDKVMPKAPVPTTEPKPDVAAVAAPASTQAPEQVIKPDVAVEAVPVPVAVAVEALNKAAAVVVKAVSAEQDTKEEAPVVAAPATVPAPEQAMKEGAAAVATADAVDLDLASLFYEGPAYSSSLLAPVEPAVVKVSLPTDEAPLVLAPSAKTLKTSSPIPVLAPEKVAVAPDTLKSPFSSPAPVLVATGAGFTEDNAIDGTAAPFPSVPMTPAPAMFGKTAVPVVAEEEPAKEEEPQAVAPVKPIFASKIRGAGERVRTFCLGAWGAVKGACVAGAGFVVAGWQWAETQARRMGCWVMAAVWRRPAVM